MEDVFFDVTLLDKNDVFNFIANHFCQSLPNFSKSEIASFLLKREENGNTGIGNGVAIPHFKMPDISNAICVFIKTKEPIDYLANDNLPVDLFLGVLIPGNNHSNVELLASLTEKFHDDKFVKRLREAETKDECYSVLIE